jgi:nucleoside-diphosphate-sugar epimerase
MRVLVSGASGFIGSHVAMHLAATGHDVLALGRDRARLAPAQRAGCRILTLDLASDDLAGAVQGQSAIIHCAARASPWGRPEEFHRDNVVATERLLAAAADTGSIRRFVHLSSPSIYFRFRDERDLGEEFQPPQRWATSYAKTKWQSECIVRKFQALSPIILRPRAVFGPGDRTIVPRLIAVAERGFFPLPSGGDAWTDITYIDNVVSAVVAALQAPAGLGGRAFNITNDEHVQIRDLLARLFGALEIRPRMVPMPRAVLLALARISELLSRNFGAGREPRITLYGAGLLSFSQTLSIEAARRDLAYAPAVSLDDGIQRFAGWWRAR